MNERKNKTSLAHAEKDQIVIQFKCLNDYKKRLELVNDKAEKMFNSMTEIKSSSLANMKMVDKSVIEGEKNFVKYIDQLIRITRSRDEVEREIARNASAISRD